MTPKKDQINALKKIKSWFSTNKSKRSDYMVLSGYAGTGKSTLLTWLCDKLNLEEGRVAFSAFTGKATSVLLEQGLRAKTLHRLLYKHRFNKKTGKYYSEIKPEGLEESLIVVDEASMLSKSLFDDLMKIRGSFKILFVGDNAQLPPVNADDFNLMEKPDFCLTRVLRQAALNPIIRLATKIRNGESWKVDTRLNDGVGYMPVTEEALESSFSTGFSNDAFLCSTNKDRVAINQWVRSEIIERGIFKSESLDVIYVGEKDQLLYNGDRVIILDNCKKQGVFNGQLFTVMKYRHVNKNKVVMSCSDVEDDLYNIIIHPHNFLQAKPSNRFELSKEHRLDFKEMGVSCDYAYCLTVHKSQGSSFENVYLRLGDSDKYIWKDLYNRWLYTAVTRASKNLYFY
jgi:exodeoxyribonuclease-5